MRAFPTIPLAGVTDMCRPAGSAPEARTRAEFLAAGGWTVELHDPPAAREDDPGLFVAATIWDPISRIAVDYVTFRTLS